MKKRGDILIVDDDQAVNEKLSETLRDLTDGRIFCAKSGKQAEEIIEMEARPEMIFMDVCLDGKNGSIAGENGIALARKLQHRAPDAEIIFISGYDDYYLDVYEVDHAWFLRKPISRERLEKAVARARERAGSGDRVFTFSWGRSEYVIPYREILCFEKKQRKVLVYRDSSENPCEFYSTMDELCSMLPGYFFRCHNSYVVNMRNVRRYARTYFDVGGHHVPISRVYEKQAREAFYDFLESED